VLLLAFALSYLAMLVLCLNRARHRGALLPANTRLPGRPAMWLLACCLFGVALWLCAQSQGGQIGVVVWLCLVMLAGVLLVLLLAWHSRLALTMAPLLMIGGGLGLL